MQESQYPNGNQRPQPATILVTSCGGCNSFVEEYQAPVLTESAENFEVLHHAPLFKAARLSEHVATHEHGLIAEERVERPRAKIDTAFHGRGEPTLMVETETKGTSNHAWNANRGFNCFSSAIGYDGVGVKEQQDVASGNSGSRVEPRPAR